MTITVLYVYPIKGCCGTALDTAMLDAQGIRFDRRWMIVRAEDGRFLTQREIPALARIRSHVDEKRLSLTFDRGDALELPHTLETEYIRRQATVWGFTGEVLDCGEVAAQWFSDILGDAYRLVCTPSDFARRVNPSYGTAEDRVGFADGYPVLLASESSLDDLNAHLLEKGADPVPMSRFRPNIVVRGASAWAEDHWKTVSVEGSRLRFRVAKPCARCAVTTIDQETGEKTGAEPLATLAQFRRDTDGKVNFATNLIHNAHGSDCLLRLGDVLHAS